jgi:RNA polymerase sigma factor (sigma-70 family)
MREPEPHLIHTAREGDRRALHELLRAIQPDVYAMALRMLWHPEDARDATQEILLKVFTHLATFRGESRFSTWVYRIAANHLHDFRIGRVEASRPQFAAFSADLLDGLAEPDEEWANSPQYQAVLEEIRVGCTLALLACIDREHRLAYILGEILELEHGEAAAALSISPAAFRKRLSRARRAIHEFLAANCGIVNNSNPCHCERRVSRATALGRVEPSRLLFVRDDAAGIGHSRVVATVRSLQATRRAAALLRASGTPGPDIAGEVLASLDKEMR